MKIWQVDSFTDKPFTGNPAGVMVLDEDISDDRMREVAMEMNLSETAFVRRSVDGLHIRWFTPESEVNLCGHATLAAAHVLWSEGLVHGNELVFSSKSGHLPVTRSGDVYTLDFPAQPPRENAECAALVKEMLGVNPFYIGTNGHDCLVVLESEDMVRNVAPDLEKHGHWKSGVCLFRRKRIVAVSMIIYTERFSLNWVYLKIRLLVLRIHCSHHIGHPR